MWYIFYLPGPTNKDKKWNLFLHQFRFTLDYVKHHAKILQKDFKEYKYMVQNLKWYGVYMRITFSSALLQKVLKFLPLTATGPEVYVATMTTILSDSYDYLVETLNHMKSLKLKDHPGENVADCCDKILVDSERLESDGAFKPDHLGYTIHIFEDTSESPRAGF